jgi:hypothetical protein
MIDTMFQPSMFCALSIDAQTAIGATSTSHVRSWSPRSRIRTERLTSPTGNAWHCQPSVSWRHPWYKRCCQRTLTHSMTAGLSGAFNCVPCKLAGAASGNEGYDAAGRSRNALVLVLPARWLHERGGGNALIRVDVHVLLHAWQMYTHCWRSQRGV